ncbi:hypothetical protein ACS5PK_02025 [Roseateles sp. DB2]|uniref:hypothetical protein n=1 Tax=Roseateles sp. DB2 TaxID=3453717 RepID=UPI003EEA8B83
MNRPSAFIAAVISASLSNGSVAAQAMSGVRIAAVHDGSVCASVDGAAMRCFGQASSKARLPVWSRDGTRIAFVDDADPALALAWLVVLDQHGQQLSRLPIKPLAAGEVQSGLRFVESLEWLDADRVVVSGTINPSSTESLVFDLSRRAVVAEYVDDAQGASFSPDGRHVLLVDGAPHFAAAAARAPVLRLDGRPVLSSLSADLGAIGPVRWSADGSRFALTARDASGHHRLVLGNAPANTAHWIDLPASKSEADAPPALFWSGQDLHVQRLLPAGQQGAAAEGGRAAPGARTQTLEDLVLVGAPGGRRWKRMTVPAPNPQRAAAILRSESLRHSLPPGFGDADVWCRACVLDKVARRRSGGGND